MGKKEKVRKIGGFGFPQGAFFYGVFVSFVLYDKPLTLRRSRNLGLEIGNVFASYACV